MRKLAKSQSNISSDTPPENISNTVEGYFNENSCDLYIV